MHDHHLTCRTGEQESATSAAFECRITGRVTFRWDVSKRTFCFPLSRKSQEEGAPGSDVGDVDQVENVRVDPHKNECHFLRGLSRVLLRPLSLSPIIDLFRPSAFARSHSRDSSRQDFIVCHFACSSLFFDIEPRNLSARVIVNTLTRIQDTDRSLVKPTSDLFIMQQT